VFRCVFFLSRVFFFFFMEERDIYSKVGGREDK